MKSKTSRELRLDETIGSMVPTKLENTRKTVNEQIQEAKDTDAEADATPEPTTDDRLAKLDLITDIQLILVDRFQRLFKVMVGTAAVMLLCLIALVVVIIAGFNMSHQVARLVTTQRSMLNEQKALVQTSKDTKEAVKDTAEKVLATKEKVDEVVDSSPKLEIDPDTGKTKVVVPVKRPKKDPDKGGKKNGGKKNGGDKASPKEPPAPPPEVFELK